MSDYVPNPNDPRDPLNPRRDADLNYIPAAGTGNGIYVVLGSLVVAVLVAGFLMFSGPRMERADQATLPATTAPIERTTPSIVPTPMPAPVLPAAPAAPAAPQQR